MSASARPARSPPTPSRAPATRPRWFSSTSAACCAGWRRPMRNQVEVLAVIVVMWLIAIAAIASLIVSAIRSSRQNRTDVVAEPPAQVGRHHEDTVEIVPADYSPHIGRRRIARETDTQRIEYPR